jgi:hypothetical protein
MRKLIHHILTAALTCLVVLGVPNGQAELQPELGSGLILLKPQSAPMASPAIKASVEGNSPRIAGTNPFAVAMNLLPDPPNALPITFRQVDVGSSAVCGIQTNGEVRCWGLNDHGQLQSPKGKFKQISVGQLHACAIKTNGRLKCWGEPTAFPTRAGYRGLYTQVSAGDDHTCALKKNRRAYCWGSNDYGELDVPDVRFKKIVAKANHTCGITDNEALLCWGEASFVSYIPPNGHFLDIATGTLHGCAIRKGDLGVICWGNQAYGQTTPAQGPFQSLASGDFHTCGLRNDHTASCWGNDSHQQLDIPVENIKSIAAGGEMTCGLDIADRTWCSGSYAYNDYLYEPLGQAANANAEEGVRPTFIPFAFLSQFAAVLGGGLVNYGKGVEKKWVGAEATAVKWQLGLALGSMIFTALGMQQPSNETNLLLQDIQAKLDKLQQSLDTVAKDVTEIKLLVAASYCNQQLNVLEQNVNDILNSARDYRVLLNRVGSLITASQQKQPLINPLIEMQSFVNEQAKSITDARDNIGRAMLGSVSASPLEVCLTSAAINRKASGKIGLDDRDFYADSYRILNIGLSAQGMALMMVEDINIYKASRILEGPLDASPSPAPLKIPPEDLAGVCEKIRNPRMDINNPRWGLAKEYCETNTREIKEQYRNYVSQLEKLGAPYTDDYQILSLKKELSGYGGSEQNLLWMRNPNDLKIGGQPYTVDHLKRDLTHNSLSFGGKGDVDLYSAKLNPKGEVWVSAGREWNDLFSIFADHSKKVKRSMKYDFLEKMESDKDGYTQKVLFSGVTRKIFWMSGQTYDMNWDAVLRDSAGLSDDASPTTKGIKCFVASGINRTRLTEVSGRVCNEVEMTATTNRIWNYDRYVYDKIWKPFPNMEEGCGSRSKSNNNKNYCFGNGVQFLQFADDSFLKDNGFLNNDYAPYADQLGSYFFRYWSGFTAGGISFWGESDMVKDAAFFPHVNKLFSVMPVLDVDKRECLESLVSPLQRSNSRDTAQIPSRCGKDLDRTIRDLIPRPDETIPEYDDLSTYVKPLRVN